MLYAKDKQYTYVRAHIYTDKDIINTYTDKAVDIHKTKTKARIHVCKLAYTHSSTRTHKHITR